MINLLPDDMKKDIRAARMNVVLIRYMLLTAVMLGVLLASCVVAYFILHSSQSNALTTSTNNVAKASTFDSVRKEATDYRNNLSIARTILNKSFSYTTVVFEITKTLPKGVVLDNISLTSTSFGQQTTFAAHAKTDADAMALKNSFQKSPLFSNVYFQNLSDNSLANEPMFANYPIAVTISAKLNPVVK